MNELMLDTADLAGIQYGLQNWPVSGITTNPTILKKDGAWDIYGRLSDIKKLCGPDVSLHVQVVSKDPAGMIAEAGYILEKLGPDTFIKIPVSEGGVAAIKTLAAEKVRVTATAVYSAFQGIMAVMAGAQYIAVYFNRMENNASDPDAAVREIRTFIDSGGSRARILAASFQNRNQIMRAYMAGAHAVTASPDLVKGGLSLACVQDAVDVFAADFEQLRGRAAAMAEPLP